MISGLQPGEGVQAIDASIIGVGFFGNMCMFVAMSFAFSEDLFFSAGPK
jgi:hypothetical protein